MSVATVASSLAAGNGSQGLTTHNGRFSQCRAYSAVVAAFLEQMLGMRLLEVSAADLGRRDMRRNAKHGHARAMAVEKAIDEMEVAGSAAEPPSLPPGGR
jgi:hypothetical protein